MRLHRVVFGVLSFSLLIGTAAYAEMKPIRALLVTGGCCHDYTQQKKILTEGISARANVVWSVVHEGDGTTDHRVSIYSDPDWAKNFDVVVHDECFADVKDAEFVRGILKPHRNGLPAVNLHCAMHSYRVSFDSFKEWFEFTGIDSRSHGPHVPLDVIIGTNKHPVIAGMTNWTTGNEELYNALEIWPGVTPLIYGQQGSDKHMVAWVNNYRGARVFSTTLGHHNALVSDPRYLDFVTRGLLWAVDKLNADYLKPAKRKAQKMVRVPINLALKKKATASATENGRPAELAVDGDLDTRWCAPNNGNNYWWQVDLGKPEEIVGARIVWEFNAAYQYVIAGSADGQTWKTLVEETKGPRPQFDEQKFTASDVRFLRITVTKAPEGNWSSFFECEVYGKEMVEKPASLFDPRLQGVQSPAGFDQTLFAAPPNVSYPTCIEATPWGDVFVGVDLNGALGREKNRGWVVRCRDTNGDGEADEFKKFAAMDSPRGLVFDNNTLYVMHPPVLEAFHDDNGDGASDRSEVLVSGLGKDLDFRGADHTCNGVRLGIDGFLYISLGDYGALKAVGKDGKEVQVYGGGIVRVRTDGSGVEVFCQGTRNTYDVAIDPLMNLFTCDNTNDGDDWNLRLSQMIATANYGYPSLYKNFSGEIMPAMNDFGGGSPTGALFMDEPGFPENFGNGLYTCQWGWNTVTRHPLAPAGATFTAEKETFIRIPRPTGIATDGQGNIYVASLKGATFDYAGPDVGFIARISHLNNEPSTFPDLKKASEKELIELLASSSAVRRLHVQREILRRDSKAALIKDLGKLATSTQPLPVRAGAVFTLGQFENATALKVLVKLSGKATLREFALRALADSQMASQVPTAMFVDALKDKDRRVRLQAIVALNRLQRTEAADAIFSAMADSDPAISHAAFRALVALRATNACFTALDKSDAAVATSALRILGNIHETQIVDGLISRLHKSTLKQPILETLCRLYHREGEWDGSWWGTRPDTSGPFFRPVTWEGTDRIVRVLKDELAKNDDKTVRSLLVLFQKYKITSPEIAPEVLQGLVADTQLDPAVRKQAFQNVLRVSDEAAMRAILACDKEENVAKQLYTEFVQDPKRNKSLETFTKLSSSGTERETELAFAVLLHVARDTNAPPAARTTAEKVIAEKAEVPALTRARMAFFPQEKQTSKSSDNIIAKIPYEDVVKRVLSGSGDAKQGAQLFESASCVKCHTVSKADPPTGPFLGDIAVRYNREELLESVLRPSAKIAQGFETTTIETKEGESFDGFVVRESGDEVEIRNLSGATVIRKNTIASRGTRVTSIMPDGLVDHLTPEELTSLLRYLQSLHVVQ